MGNVAVWEPEIISHIVATRACRNYYLLRLCKQLGNCDDFKTSGFIFTDLVDALIQYLFVNLRYFVLLLCCDCLIDKISDFKIRYLVIQSVTHYLFSFGHVILIVK